MSEVKINDIVALRDFATKKFDALKTGQDGMAKEYDNKLNEVLDAIDAIKLEQKKLLVRDGIDNIKEASLERKSFKEWLKKGSLPEEAKALSTFNDPSAGYLVAPAEYLNEINQLVTEISPVRSVARVIPISGGSIIMPKVNSHIQGGWTKELGTAGETEPGYGQNEVFAHELTAYTEVSYRLKEDSAFDVESLLNEEFVEQFAYFEGQAFINGNGVNKPFGLLASSEINTAKTNTTDSVSIDGLMNAVYSLKDVYRRGGASWMANRLTYREIRKLVAGTSASELLWAPTLRDGQPDRLLGYPVYEAPDMTAPNTLTGLFGTNDVAMLFGNFRRGYTIADRMELRVIRDDVSKARTGRIAFTAMKWVGGEVTRGEAITKLVVTNS